MNSLFNETDIILVIYRGLISRNTENGIPVNLRSTRVVGTVQDDPFDCWIEDEIKRTLPDTFEVFHSGQLTTPDLVVRDRKSGLIVGLEIKKLIQNDKGKDPRGMTIDYNSCLPCGQAMVKVGGEANIVPCYYLFALLSPESDRIITLIILDGDFINYDFELHKEAKFSNFTEYNHGPYGEGSVRHRKMYTYPNPLNSQLDFFHLHQLLVVKKSALAKRPEAKQVKEQIVRTDKYNNSFYYSLIDETNSKSKPNKLVTLTNIFDACKKRKPKERTAYIPDIPKLDEAE
ncbi:MAG: hypothetical protein IKH15_06115 [Bacteroidales bacterium]|nr:hypothetical protein [Bacteroidales bacterium]